MAFEDIEIEEEEFVPKYWNFEKVGDNVEGNVFSIVKDDYGNDRIVLDMGDDEDGNVITTTLPGHKNLQRYVKKIKKGDYIRVELTKIIPPKEEGRYPFNIYKVQKDEDRAVDYGDGE